VHGAPELGLPSGKAGHAALAAGPVAGKTVDQDLLESCALQSGTELRDRVIVRREDLHALEAGARGGLEALEERQLVEQP
jgi:hypothetical protein